MPVDPFGQGTMHAWNALPAIMTVFQSGMPLVPGVARDVRDLQLQNLQARMDASDAIRRGLPGLAIRSPNLTTSCKHDHLFGTWLGNMQDHLAVVVGSCCVIKLACACVVILIRRVIFLQAC